jgi:hypothetical protein
MPKLLEESVITFEFEDLRKRRVLKRPASVPRASGVHVSGILRVLGEAAGVLKVGEPLDEEYPLRMAVGIAWEEFVASMYPKWRWQPGEKVVDEIAMNCDGYNNTLHCLEEAKATWKSSASRRGPDFLNEWMWMMQGRAYGTGYREHCQIYGTSRVRWHVLYLSGDYRGSGPQYIRYLVEFTEKEIADTWKMLLDNRHRALAE